MTAICGIVHVDKAPLDPEILDRMVAAAGYRRPAVAQHWLAGNAGFAGQRTEVWSAPSFASLPSVRESIACIADARLDNRDELRHRLRTSGWPTDENAGDAELILAVFMAWGEQGLDCLQGAYAAALWDAGRQQLRLLRDRCGERALYWCETPTAWLFASEPSQLLASGLVARDYNLKQIVAYLVGAAPEPSWSYFRDIHRLPEAHYLRLGGGKTSLQRYWRLEAIRVQPWRRSEAAAALAERLSTAVSRRLPPAGETGMLLSGGLDSASVAAAAADSLASGERRLHAFTWSSSLGDGIDERQLSSALIASRPNILEHPVPADSLWPLSRYPEAYADPNSPETSAYPDLLLTTLETAYHNSIKVLLNGLGGDPVVGWLTPDLALLLRGRWLAAARRWRASGLRGSSLIRQWRLAFARRPLPDWLTRKGKSVAQEAGLDRPPVPLTALLSPLGFRRYAIGAPSNAAALERFDRLSRRLGVRIAAPWYDAMLASLVLSFPDGALSAEPPAKRLLREAMAGRLPEPLANAPTVKANWSQLAQRGFLHGGRPVIEALLSRSKLADLGLVDTGTITAVYRQTASGGVIMPRLQEIITAECWLHAHELSYH